MIDKRHTLRIKTVQELYSLSFHDQKSLLPRTKDILSRTDELDVYIHKNAPKYDIEHIAKVDLAILRLAIYELIIEKTEPAKVIINEAIELAKDMAGDKSPAFVNAVLGSVYRELYEAKVNEETSHE